MTERRYFQVKNAMLLANLLANAMGVAVVIVITTALGNLYSPEMLPLASSISYVFIPLSFLIPTLLTLIYEKPIRRYLNELQDRKTPSEATTSAARARLLNEPFFLIGLDIIIWLIAALLYSGFFWAYGGSREIIQEAFLQNIFTGIISATIAFFLLEYVLQRKIIGYFFPIGGISITPGTIRIRIRTRLIALLLAINIIPLMAIFLDVVKIPSIYQSPHGTMGQFQALVLFEIGLFIIIGLGVVFLVSSNLTKPLEEIISVLKHIQNGNFDHKVQVTSNDEIGYTGDVINEMERGLIELTRMQYSLSLAKEVQQTLLPKENFLINSFEIAGTSVYYDETGGDYYDFIPIGKNGGHKVGIAIGDVSGHGISAALLMATVRSSLRQRASLSGTSAEIITDVNHQLSADVKDSGQFMTLFFMIIDTERKELDWIRAGHDPAILYDRQLETFSQLKGQGLALGVDSSWTYTENTRLSVTENQVLLLCTDGVWEIRNQAGDMMGKKPILNIIRENAASSAKEILQAIIDGLQQFGRGAKVEDDITLVVIKNHTDHLDEGRQPSSPDNEPGT